MRRQILDSTGRRGTVIVASAAVLCLGGALAACGGGAADDGYVAVGAAGTGPEGALSGAVPPSGKVTLVPLDRNDGRGGGGRGGEDGSGGKGDGAGGSTGGRAGGDAASSGTSADRGRHRDGSGGAGDGAGGPSGTPGASGSGGGGTGGSGGTGGAGSGPADPSAPSTPGPGTTPPAGPAVLVVGAPERAGADERWCEKVTVEFRNTGGSPVRSGTATFATHIIGGLGIDWATVETSAPLPAPIGAGAARTKTYTVCVDAWRVPLGMHVETRDVTAVSK
ncbi:hypothetical protein ACFVT1_04185 [Streptomyces sp. NPDC057963]|uniref:hypothetical protein n=1 Tax=Streptomyces sp. NPDC057963 TaxID=3346290 RepID=UPI0036EAE65A